MIFFPIGSDQCLTAAVAVDVAEVRFGREQLVALVLTVNVNQVLPQLAQHRNGCRSAVDFAAAFAAQAQTALQQQGAVLRLKAETGERLLYCRVDVLKQGADKSGLFAGADDVSGGALSHDGVDGVDNDTLSGAGLTGEHVQPAAEIYGGFFDNRDIFDIECL